MPGIVGLITRMPRERAYPEFLRMTAAVSRDPSYSAGTWADEASGIYVGWTARNGDAEAAIPLRDPQGDLVLVFSGEHFPAPGAGLSSSLLSAAGQTAFPSSLNGRFHGLLADRRSGAAMLFNDRYGLHRLYYYEARDTVYFAAEAKAILAVRPELRTLDPRSLGDFAVCGRVLENRTFFAGLHVLPPAAAWTFRGGALERKTAYFDPREWEEQEPLAPEAYYRQLRDSFAETLPRYFRTPERIGLSLTGGLDTRVILAWQKSPPGALPCYTFGSTYRDCRDVAVARRVARACRQPHYTIPVADDFLARFPHYAERTVFLSEGCVDIRHAPDLYVNEKAAAIAPVRMTGNYGDEVLRWLRVFKPATPPTGIFNGDLSGAIGDAAQTFTRIAKVHPLSFALFRQLPWHHYGLLALEETQLAVRTPFLDHDIVRTVYRAPQSAQADNNLRLRLIADGSPALARIPTDLGFNGGALLRRFEHFTMKLEYAYDYGMPQWAARVDRFCSPLRFDRLILGRHKFYHFRVWYRDALASYIREMLLDGRTLSRPYVDARGLQAAVEGHLRGTLNYTTAIHKILTLELLHRLFLDR